MTLGHASARETTEGDAPFQPINPYLREASSHHCSTVDHGPFLPHKEPWEQVKKGRPLVSTEQSLGQETFAM